MTKKYNTVVVEPRKAPYEENLTFPEIADLLGYVENFHLYDNIYALLTGDIAPLPELCRDIVLQEKGPLRIPLFGTFVIIKRGDDYEFESLNETEVKEALYIFRSTSETATVFI